MKNIADLIKDLSTAYELLRDREMELAEAKEVANLGGKLIKAASIQLKYNQYMKSNEPIPFLETGEKESDTKGKVNRKAAMAMGN